MTKDIRIIYIVSIIAIVAFLGMQFYWLYNRYQYSVLEYTETITEQVIEANNEYSRYRDSYVNKERAGKGYRNMASYSMGYETDGLGNRHHVVSVTAWRFQPWRVLGVDLQKTSRTLKHSTHFNWQGIADTMKSIQFLSVCLSTIPPAKRQYGVQPKRWRWSSRILLIPAV